MTCNASNKPCYEQPFTPTAPALIHAGAHTFTASTGSYLEAYGWRHREHAGSTTAPMARSSFHATGLAQGRHRRTATLPSAVTVIIGSGGLVKGAKPRHPRRAVTMSASAASSALDHHWR